MDENGEVFERSLTYRKIMKDQWIQGHFQIEHPNFNIQPTFETTPQPAQTPWSQLVVRVPQNGKAKGTPFEKEDAGVSNDVVIAFEAAEEKL